jgi:hypothetical protein
VFGVVASPAATARLALDGWPLQSGRYENAAEDANRKKIDVNEHTIDGRAHVLMMVPRKQI